MRKAGLLTTDDEAKAGAFAQLVQSDAKANAGAALVHAVNASSLFDVAPGIRLQLYLERAVLSFFSGVVEFALNEAEQASEFLDAGMEELRCVVEFVAVADARRPARMFPILGFFVEKLAIPEAGAAMRVGKAAHALASALHSSPERISQRGAHLEAKGFSRASDRASEAVRIAQSPARTFGDDKPKKGQIENEDKYPHNQTQKNNIKNEVDRRFIFASLLFMLSLTGVFATLKDFTAISVSPAANSPIANPHNLSDVLFPFWLAFQHAMCIVSTIFRGVQDCYGSSAPSLVSRENGIFLFVILSAVAAFGACIYIGHVCDGFVDLIGKMNQNNTSSEVTPVIIETGIKVSVQAEQLRLKKPAAGPFEFFRYTLIYLLLLISWWFFAILFLVQYMVRFGLAAVLIAFSVILFLLGLSPLSSLAAPIAIVLSLLLLAILSSSNNDSSNGGFVNLIFAIMGSIAALLASLISPSPDWPISIDKIGIAGLASVAFYGLARAISDPSMRIAQAVGSGDLGHTLRHEEGWQDYRELLGIGVSLSMLIIPFLAIPLFATLNPLANDVTLAADESVRNEIHFSPAPCGHGFREIATTKRLFLRLGGGAAIDETARLTLPDGALVAGVGDNLLVASAELGGDWGLAKRGTIVPIKAVDAVNGVSVTARGGAGDNPRPGSAENPLAQATGRLDLEPASIAVRLCAPVGSELPPELAALDGAN